MNVLLVTFGAIGVVAALDFLLAARWNNLYFRFGLPIFVRRIERPQGILDLSLTELESSSATAAAAPLSFHRLSPTTVAFREKVFGGIMHYVPIMHGVIRYDPAEGVVRVIGILKWFVLVFVISLVALLGRRFTEIMPVMLAVLGIVYFIQAIRYNRVASKLRNASEKERQVK